MSLQTEYWKGRWEQQEQRAHDAADTYMREIESIYREASRDLQGQINTWYARVADNNQVSMADARHLLNAKELKEFKWTVQDYIKAGKENGISADWSKQLENASARFHITRLEAIKVELQNTVETLYGRELDVVDRMAKQTTLDSYLHAAFEIQKEVGVGWDVAGLNTKAIERIITKPWTTDGKNFSTRIWESKDKLINEVSRMMTQNLMTGGTVRDLVDKLSAKMDVSKTQAARLLYTESAYFQTQAQGESFKDLGVKQYIYIATLDDRTSDVCREMDGQVFKMEDFQPGVTAPPLHPWCRSATAPYFADMAGLGERAARDPETGQTYYVPRSMKYDDWKNTFADDGAKDGLTPVNSTDKIINNLEACKTVSEVEQWMKQQNWFRVSGKDNQNEKIDLTGCDPDAAIEVARAYQTVFDAYPKMIGRIDAVRTMTLKDRTFAQCYTRSGGRVELNVLYYSDLNKLKKAYRSSVKSGFHPKGTSWKSIVIHEIGHAVDGTLSNLCLAGGLNKFISKDVSAAMRPNVMHACGLHVSDAITEVSGYAAKNAREWFAECFAEMLDSEKPRKVATEFKKQLDEYMKKVK